MINPSGRVVAVADSRVQECLAYGFKEIAQVEEIPETTEAPIAPKKKFKK